MIYRLHEAYTGARITTSATRVGGMMADLPEGWIDQFKQFLITFPRRWTSATGSSRTTRSSSAGRRAWVPSAPRRR